MPKGATEGRRTITVMVTDREYEALRKAAFEGRVTMSAYARQAITDQMTRAREAAAAERAKAKRAADLAAKKAAKAATTEGATVA